MSPKLPKISTESCSAGQSSRRADTLISSSTLDESEALAILTPTSPSPSPWRMKMVNPKINAIRRHFSLFDRSKLDQVNDEIESSWNCGICLETAVEPCVTRCGHMFCQTHLSNWLSTRPLCPVCENSCTLSEDLVPFFERAQLSPLFTPSTEPPSQPSRSLTLSPLCDGTSMDGTVSDDSTTSSKVVTAEPGSPGGLKPLLSDMYVHYAGLTLRVLGLGILLAALLPGGFFSSSIKQ